MSLGERLDQRITPRLDAPNKTSLYSRSVGSTLPMTSLLVLFAAIDSGNALQNEPTSARASHWQPDLTPPYLGHREKKFLVLIIGNLCEAKIRDRASPNVFLGPRKRVKHSPGGGATAGGSHQTTGLTRL